MVTIASLQGGHKHQLLANCPIQGLLATSILTGLGHRAGLCRAGSTPSHVENAHSGGLLGPGSAELAVTVAPLHRHRCRQHANISDLSKSLALLQGRVDGPSAQWRRMGVPSTMPDATGLSTRAVKRTRATRLLSIAPLGATHHEISLPEERPTCVCVREAKKRSRIV